MGYLGLVKSALLCIDFLAWPVIALGYPLFASIRAIEADSKYHMKKLVIYWTLFALISLFEFTFAKIIEWIPGWSTFKLIVIFCSVMPRFDGACLVYQDLVHPCLPANPQAVINRFYKAKKKKPRELDMFLDVAGKYIKENGSEAFEKRIASKLEHKEPDNSQRFTIVHEPKEKYVASLSEQGPDTAQIYKEILESTEKSAATEVKLAEVKEIIPPEASVTSRLPETLPTKKVQAGWTCTLCEVTTTSKKTQTAHLQGNKHKSMCEYLKSTGISKEANPKVAKFKVEEASQEISSEKIEERVKFQVTNRRKKRVILKQERQQKSSEKIAERVQVQVPGEQLKREEPDHTQSGENQVHEKNAAAISAHMKGSDTTHKNNVDKSAATEAKQVHHAEVNEITPPEESSRNGYLEILLVKKAHREWTCTLCEVTATSEKTLNAHIQGKKHASKYELLRNKLHPNSAKEQLLIYSSNAGEGELHVDDRCEELRIPASFLQQLATTNLPQTTLLNQELPVSYQMMISDRAHLLPGGTGPSEYPQP